MSHLNETCCKTNAINHRNQYLLKSYKSTTIKVTKDIVYAVDLDAEVFIVFSLGGLPVVQTFDQLLEKKTFFTYGQYE